MMKKGFNMFDCSDSYSITIIAKKYINRLNVVMKINDGTLRHAKYSQYELYPSYLRVKTIMLPNPLAKPI